MLSKRLSKGLSHIKTIFYNSVKAGKLLNKPVEESYITDLSQVCINQDILVSSVIINGGWIEIDTVSDLHSKTTLERIEL